MKKFYFIPFLLLVTIAPFGQNISITAGGNISTTKNLMAHPENKIGWYSGLSFKIPFQEKLFLQPEILYSTKGNTGGITNWSGLQANRYNYLNLPVLLHYCFDKKTSIALGPEFGYLLSAEMVFDGRDNIDITESYPSRFDAAACIGLQYRPIKQLGIEIRYNYGFNTVYNVAANGMRYNEKNGAHRVFQFGIKYAIYQNK